VKAVFVALPAVVLDRLAGAVLARRHLARTILPRYAGSLAMTYTIRPATLADIPAISHHREQMFRDIGIPARFDEMAVAVERWLGHALVDGTYRGWMAVDEDGAVVAGAGLIVIPWPPGPISMDPRCGFIFNIYTDPAHRQRGLARRLVEAMHAWCRAEGLERTVLNASTFGRSLYESLGYVATDEPMMRLRL
jgi:GNAT superfamily N-acetyltransferase